MPRRSSSGPFSRLRVNLRDRSCAEEGRPWKDYAFHTDEEQNPWWMVDLGVVARIHHIRVFNRDRVPELGHRRASPLVVEGSEDGIAWRVLFQTQPGQIFGGYSGGSPLLWSTEDRRRRGTCG
jgi:hypothetical protein